MTVVIEFPQPDAMLTMNQRLHWAPKSQRTKAWRNAAAIHSCAQCPPIRPLPRSIVAVSLPVSSLNIRRDPHNWYPTVKAVIDGLVDAGVFTDDSAQYVATVEPTFTKGGNVIITISPIEAT